LLHTSISPLNRVYTWLNDGLTAEIDLGAASLAGLLPNHISRCWAVKSEIRLGGTWMIQAVLRAMVNRCVFPFLEFT